MNLTTTLFKEIDTREIKKVKIEFKSFENFKQIIFTRILVM